MYGLFSGKSFDMLGVLRCVVRCDVLFCCNDCKNGGGVKPRTGCSLWIYGSLVRWSVKSMKSLFESVNSFVLLWFVVVVYGVSTLNDTTDFDEDGSWECCCSIC